MPVGERDREAEVDSASNERLRAGACSARGLRPSNEDQHVMDCDWCSGGAAGLFAVLDGHGGPAVAILASRLLANHLRGELEAEEGAVPRWSTEDGRRDAAQRAFVALDKQLSTKEVAHGCGSTCVAAVVWPEGEEGAEAGPDGPDYRVLLANLGDSRGLVVRGRNGAPAREDEQTVDLLAETQDHKPSLPEERRRIVEAGGTVTGLFGPPRVDGDLSLSRAFGDFRLKTAADLAPERQKISSQPDVYEVTCRRGDMLVLACDGAFDVMTSLEVAALARQKLGLSGPEAPERPGDPAVAAEAVVQAALDRGTMDNVTCVVVQL